MRNRATLVEFGCWLPIFSCRSLTPTRCCQNVDLWEASRLGGWSPHDGMTVLGAAAQSPSPGLLPREAAVRRRRLPAGGGPPRLQPLIYVQPPGCEDQESGVHRPHVCSVVTAWSSDTRQKVRSEQSRVPRAWGSWTPRGDTGLQCVSSAGGSSPPPTAVSTRPSGYMHTA